MTRESVSRELSPPGESNLEVVHAGAGAPRQRGGVRQRIARAGKIQRLFDHFLQAQRMLRPERAPQEVLGKAHLA